MRPQWHFPDRVRYLLPTVLFAVGIAILGLVLAFILLETDGRRVLMQEIGKLCAQFIVIVILGLMVTRRLDNFRENEADLRASRDRKESHVRRLIDLTHDVDLARLLISANRSVKTWSDQMSTRVIPAYTELRDLQHDHKTAVAAKQPIFVHETEISKGLQDMGDWFSALSKEFAENKKSLSELQRLAEDDRTRQDELWETMKLLPLLRDIVNDEGPRYGEFRKSYVTVLTIMRAELSVAGIPSSRAKPPR
jgi:hypothetical protein